MPYRLAHALSNVLRAHGGEIDGLIEAARGAVGRVDGGYWSGSEREAITASGRDTALTRVAVDLSAPAKIVP